MFKIGVVYFSKTDVTHSLATSLIEGVHSTKEFEVVEHAISGEEIVHGRFRNEKLMDDLNDCHGIVFGTPTYMGGPAAQFKAFADASSELWTKQAWAGKVAAGLTCGVAMNGDQSSTLYYLMTFSSQHGMFWVGLDAAYGYTNTEINRLGCEMGVVAQSDDNTPHPTDLATANYLGVRVGKHIKRLFG